MVLNLVNYGDLFPMPETAKETANVKKLYDEALKAAKDGRLETTLELLERANQIDPEDDAVAFKLAYYYDLLGEDEKAIVLYESLAARQPTYEGVLLNLSVLYEDAGLYDDAEECLHRLLTSQPNHARGRMFYRHVDSSLDMQIPDDTDRRYGPRNLVLETPVTDFELSVRARNCLRKMNIRTLGDLLKITEAELLSYKNFGETSLQEIREMLSRKGLRLGQASEEALAAQRAEALRAVAATVPPEVLNQSVSDMEFGARSSKALKLLGINTVADLISRTEAELLGVQNFGDTSLDEVKEKLGKLGLTLRKVD